jgi:hypothetical protein
MATESLNTIEMNFIGANTRQSAHRLDDHRFNDSFHPMWLSAEEELMDNIVLD